MLTSTEYDKGGPFGNPDGAIEKLSEFVQFDDAPEWPGLATRRDDRTARILFGRKGSGKTLYSRLLEDYAEQSSALHVFRQNAQPPSTEHVSRFHYQISDHQRSEAWQKLWRRAIFRSTASLFFCDYDPILVSSVSDDITTRLFRADFSRLMKPVRTRQTVFGQIAEVLVTHHTRNALLKYINDREWEFFEQVVLKKISSYHPICIYLDGIDENFRYAPAEWIDCQKGLFYTIVHFLRERESKGHLNLHACPRDIVYFAIMTSEHRTRVLDNHYIRILDWTPPAIRTFLREKVLRLPRAIFNGRSSGIGQSSFVSVATRPAWEIKGVRPGR